MIADMESPLKMGAGRPNLLVHPTIAWFLTGTEWGIRECPISCEPSEGISQGLSFGYLEFVNRQILCTECLKEISQDTYSSLTQFSLLPG
jgi:hypothetical protein